MKRRLAKFVVFLLLGAIVNVAVAWGCALSAKTPPIYDETTRCPEITPGDLNCWTDNRQNGWPKWPTSKHEIRSSGCRVVYLSREANALLATAFDIWQVKSGWPLDAMKGVGRRTWHVPTFNIMIESSARSAVLAPDNIPFLRLSEPKLLPLDPVWPGFALDTSIYATLAWFCTIGSFRLRRLVRKRRGCCSECAYDLRGKFSSRCPECGAQDH